jgi:hypothetical protein
MTDATPAPSPAAEPPEGNARRLAWFTDDELADELNRRLCVERITEPPEGLREAIVQVLTDTTWVTLRADDGHLSVAQADEGDVADALLAGPLAAVLRQAEADRAAVERVRALADEFDTPAAPGPWPEGTRSLYGGGQVCYRIRCALDGDRG